MIKYIKMIIDRNYDYEERLYSTGYDELDELLERAFCEGYEYALEEREFTEKKEADIANSRGIGRSLILGGRSGMYGRYFGKKKTLKEIDKGTDEEKAEKKGRRAAAASGAAIGGVSASATAGGVMAVNKGLEKLALNIADQLGCSKEEAMKYAKTFLKSQKKGFAVGIPIAAGMSSLGAYAGTKKYQKVRRGKEDKK